MSTFNDYKDKISIIQVASYLGYQFDKSKGKKQPSFVLTDNRGNITDRIYIKNPENSSIQGYWRRSNIGVSKGDLISFIKENLSSFPESNSARNEIDAINKVLNSFSGEINQNIYFYNKSHQAKSFDLNRYEREKGNIDYMMNFFNKRNISRDTVNLFSDFIELITDKQQKYKYKNLGFPYQNPGENEILGYEVRGMGNYKGKAEGSNSTTALWIADFTNGERQPKNLYFAESSYDIMSFVELNRLKINLEDSIFFSTGGSFSDKQFKGAIERYPLAKPNLLFDNDLNGKMYDVRAFCLLKNINLKTHIKPDETIHFSLTDKEFDISIENFNFKAFLMASKLRNNGNIILNKPVAKDWNDMLLKETEDWERTSKYDKISNSEIKLKR